jgi:hypothetical protein
MATSTEIDPKLLTRYQEQIQMTFPVLPQEPRKYPEDYVKTAIRTVLTVFPKLDRSTMSLITRIPRTTLYDTLVKFILGEKVKRIPSSSTRLRGRPVVLFEWVKPVKAPN